MTREEIIQDINPRIAEEFEIDPSVIKPEAKIIDALELDSLSLVDMIALVDAAYHVRIPNEELKKLATFNDLYDFIFSHQKA